jgi:hypothetical protein
VPSGVFLANSRVLRAKSAFVSAVRIIIFCQEPAKRGGVKIDKKLPTHTRVTANKINYFCRRSGHFGDGRNAQLVLAGAQPRGTIPRLPGTPMFRVLTHTRSLGIGKGKSGKTAENGRTSANRPTAENGRANVARIAPLASQRPFRPEVPRSAETQKTRRQGRQNRNRPGLRGVARQAHRDTLMGA